MFERMQTSQHVIANSTILVSYDRLSTRFIVKANGDIVFNKLLLFLPIHNATLTFDETIFTLRIRWFLIWSSNLSVNNEIIVKELLYRRRKRSIGLLMYFVFASVVKVTIGLTT